MVYDIGARHTFENAARWLEKARLLGGGHLEACLVGNKSDIDVADRQVSTEEGAQMANALGVSFLETSAKNGSNVNETFVRMSSRIKKSVDERGLAGIANDSLQASGFVKVGKGDKVAGRQRCC